MHLVLAALFFLPPEADLLQKRAEDVPREELLSSNCQTLIDDLFSVARGERKDLEARVMVGLAAPQVGVLKRIILVDMGVTEDRKNLGDLRAYINPEIIWYSDEIEIGREGCYSVNPCLCGLVPRSSHIKIRALDRSGADVEEELSGFTARIFQHEVDHLNGIRFPDRVGPEGILHWVEKTQYGEYRENFLNWPVRCPWIKWMEMKNGTVFSASD
ncbi:MAG: peptide deformylase [Chlamydiae bacterium]|nr:peptide deformylase [Chlamydiota bacterium]